MVTDTALIEKREELKRRLAAGEYKTLVGNVLKWFDHRFRRTTFQAGPTPYWNFAIIFSLGSTLIGFISLYLAGELLPHNNAFERLGLSFEFGVLWLTLLNFLDITAMIVLDRYINRIMIFCHDSLIDATGSQASLEKVKDWLQKASDQRLHIIFALIGGSLLSLFIGVGSVLRGISFGLGSVIGLFVLGFIASMGIYLVWVAFFFSKLLYGYDLKLFQSDPASSELIHQLSRELSFLIYIVTIFGTFGALLTIMAGKLLQLLGAAQLLLIWLPLIVLFILNQSSLSSLIQRAKWKTLNEIQAKVEKLQAAENLENKETMETINRLMDYHDRVKATRDSALDFRTYLSFFNSLLLPLLAFVLGNLDRLIALLQSKT